jgi:hypothetical protein
MLVSVQLTRTTCSIRFCEVDGIHVTLHAVVLQVVGTTKVVGACTVQPQHEK